MAKVPIPDSPRPPMFCVTREWEWVASGGFSGHNSIMRKKTIPVVPGTFSASLLLAAGHGSFIAGGIGVGALAFAFFLSTTQSGCRVGPCLTMLLPEDAAAPNDVGPCLSMILDGGERDANSHDAGVGPCLTAPPADAGEPDVSVGPCLSIAPPDAGASLQVPGKIPSRLEAIAKLERSGVLPPDVVTKLRNRGQG